MFDFTELSRNLNMLPDRLEMALKKYGDTTARQLEAEAKKNRKWIDRTAHARQRLQGGSELRPRKLIIYLQHGVDYGVYLEFAHEKKYAIVYPTLRREAPRVMNGLRGVMNK